MLAVMSQPWSGISMVSIEEDSLHVQLRQEVPTTVCSTNSKLRFGRYCAKPLWLKNVSEFSLVLRPAMFMLDMLHVHL